jgi:hypothetical protein
MMFGLSGLVTKLIGIAAVVVVIGGIILAQHFKINSQARTIAELRLSTMLLKNANTDQAETIDKITRDKAEFEKRAAVAEAEKKRLTMAADTRLKATIKRLTDNATPDDKARVTPAIGAALSIVRGK